MGGSRVQGFLRQIYGFEKIFLETAQPTTILAVYPLRLSADPSSRLYFRETSMPSYHVEFANSAGERAEAALNASSLPQLAQRLQDQQCKLLRVRTPAPDRSVGAYWRRISDAETTTFLRQLATNLENGVSLADAL